MHPQIAPFTTFGIHYSCVGPTVRAAEAPVEVVAQSYPILAAVAAATALILIGLIVRRIVRSRAERALRPQALPLTVQPYLETPDGRVRLSLPNLDAGGCVLGRAPDADVHLDAITSCAESISARHARIYRDATSGFVVIEALDTARGVLVNGRRAARKNLLKDRWIIGVGDCTLVYRDGNPDTGPLQ